MGIKILQIPNLSSILKYSNPLRLCALARNNSLNLFGFNFPQIPQINADQSRSFEPGLMKYHDWDRNYLIGGAYSDFAGDYSDFAGGYSDFAGDYYNFISSVALCVFSVALRVTPLFSPKNQ